MKTLLLILASATLIPLGGCSLSVDRDRPSAYYWNDGPRYGRIYGYNNGYRYGRDWDRRDRVIIRDRDGVRAHVDIHD
jgi:hypothetical protein